MLKKKNGFTLIELIAVLVILAVIALIVTPLVMNIVNKARESANKRSVDGYGKSVELAIATYLLDNGDYPTDLNSLTVEYSGNEVECNVKVLNEDGSIYLSECVVAGMEVKDAKTDDGWYHYGKRVNKDIDDNKTYQAYNIGDVVTYNGMNFYVIEASDETKDSVTLLKELPLSYDEVQTYSSGTGASTNNSNGYGGMQFGTNDEYASSYAKVAVDAWTNDKLKETDLKEDSLGYKTRLITFDELTNNLGYSMKAGSTIYTINSDVTPSWIHNSSYWYWTMSPYGDFGITVWLVHDQGVGSSWNLGSFVDDNSEGVIRPVITLLKSAIESN